MCSDLLPWYPGPSRGGVQETPSPQEVLEPPPEEGWQDGRRDKGKV